MLLLFETSEYDVNFFIYIYMQDSCHNWFWFDLETMKVKSNLIKKYR